jgi:hypothetical protein
METPETPVISQSFDVGKGTIEIINSSERLATWDKVKPNIDMKWAIWNKDKKAWENGSKSYVSNKDFRVISVSMNEGDVAILHFETHDGTKVSYPISSLKVELCDLAYNSID